ncbi:MAG: hypothetical protein GYB67_01660 [Chloroflexi bacterium]|nr:hypothetical protein [Chloroflexota bacterium]
MSNTDTLQELIDQWVKRASEAREKAQMRGQPNAQYYNGVMNTYLQVVKDLRAAAGIAAPPQTAAAPSTPAPSAAAAPPAAAPPAAVQPDSVAALPEYVRVGEAEVTSILTNAGLFTRELQRHTDGAYTAIFSKLQPLGQDERLNKLRRADGRIRVLEHGALSDSGDPFIEFAFVQSNN